jgi:hypothetical protein
MDPCPRSPCTHTHTHTHTQTCTHSFTLTVVQWTCSLEKDPQADEHGSTCILRIRAGPPYEDTAFRIINKEWEYSHKKGFKCTFERGILHLYFNFKRQRYRR